MSSLKIGNAYARRLDPAPQSNVVYITPHDWPASRQLALMLLRRTPFVKEVTDTLARSTAKPCAADWRFLLDNKFAARTDRFGWHCTAGGSMVADDLAFRAAGELGLHLFKSDGDRFSVTVRCTCGHVVSLSKNQGHIHSRTIAAQSRHLAAVEDGTFKPIGDVLDQILGNKTG